MFEFIQKGGPVMYPIILCSMLALAIVIERIYHLYKLHLESALISFIFSAIRKLNYQTPSFDRLRMTFQRIDTRGQSIDFFSVECFCRQCSVEGLQIVARILQIVLGSWFFDRLRVTFREQNIEFRNQSLDFVGSCRMGC